MTGEFAIAVHTLVYLNHKKTFLSSEELAENVCTNPARIRKVMANLKKAGLVNTKEGINGGYCFPLEPDQVTLRQIDEAVHVKLVSASWSSGNAEKECRISSGMADIMEDIYTRLDEICKLELEKTTILDIDIQLFGQGKR